MTTYQEPTHISTSEDAPKLLVIDDDNSNLQVIIKYFEGRSYRILYAPNGRHGYEVALKELPDLIIMDWAMPQMNGIDTTLKLKATDETKDIPVVMATGVMTSSEDLKRALEAGAIDYLRKPFDPLELTARINAAMTLSQSFQEIRRQNHEIQGLMKKEKILLQDQIDHKERELSIQALHSQEKNQLLSGLRDELMSLGKEFKIESSNSFRRVIRRIKETIQVDNNADSFLMHFENVHPHFFNLIGKHCDQLTTNELKLCSYIKIGMSNKEIAQISGVEVGTVKSNINRLKKKLELSAEDNIRAFITNLS